MTFVLQMLVRGQSRPVHTLKHFVWLVLLHHCCCEEVQVLKTAAGFTRASQDELEALFRDNLEADLRAFKGHQYHVDDLYQLIKSSMHAARSSKHLSIIIIKDNVIHAMPLADKWASLSSKRVAYMKAGLENATRQGVVFPDTIFVLNTWDEGRCGPRTPPPRRCPAPLFSLIKQWDWSKQEGLQQDILLPFFNHFYQDLIFYPWEKKRQKALMRAAMQNGMSANCTRMWLVHLSKTTPQGPALLDVGITNNLKKGFSVQLAPYMDIVDHAKWKYLISADGFTASCRFGKLLQMNSVVLKEQSRWIEYYYRSVKAGEHYMAFTKDTVMDVLQTLEQQDEQRLQQIATAGQLFAYKYLSQHSKALYVQEALLRYNQLFADIQQFMASLDLQKQQQQQQPMLQGVLALLQQHGQQQQAAGAPL